MDQAELKDRTKGFALRVLRLVDAIPRSPAGRAVAGQLARSGTAIGANYRAACRGRSRREFTARLAVVVEEADETVYWLELAAESQLVKPELLGALTSEARELTAIFTAAHRTSSTTNPHQP